MMNRKHVMIDLETLGSTPGCAILSFGAVEFFPATSTLGQEFYAVVDVQSCFDAGLKAEGGAFYWWLMQSHEARTALVAPSYTLAEVLASFIGYLYEPADTLIWAHGPSFDLAVLAAAFTATHQAKPWAFRNERDTRTILDLAGGRKMPAIQAGHHALEDAKSQAREIMNCMHIIAGTHGGKL